MESYVLKYISSLVHIIGMLSLLLGVLSAFWPHKSIAVYIWLMARFNWIVRPADEDRELRNTSRFGYLLIGLGTATILLMLTAFDRQ